MNYNTQKRRLRKLMQLYLLYMLECTDYDDLNTLNREIFIIKDHIDKINMMSKSEKHHQVKTVTHTIESWMNI